MSATSSGKRRTIPLPKLLESNTLNRPNSGYGTFPKGRPPYYGGLGPVPLRGYSPAG